jgi:hypothetical protein
MKTHTLTVELKLPIKTEPLVGAPALTFHHWLPIGKINGIHITENDVNLLLWFDLESTWWASQPTEDEIKNHVNVLAHYVRAEITVHEVASELATYMKNRDFKRLPAESERLIQAEYDKLGQQILEVILRRFNRLITYAHSVKGQYWLLKYEVDIERPRSYFQSFEARGQIDAGDFFQFKPGVGDKFSISMPAEDKYIGESEWAEVSDFVRGKERTPLVHELLAGSEQLAANGYYRSALTEAVTALEVAISAFGRSQNKNQKLASIVGPRLGVDMLQKQIEHMGLSGTVKYLLPLLLPEDILPSEILSGCRKALDERQNVVHNGTRNVSNIDHFIGSIRSCCKILRDYCSEESLARDHEPPNPAVNSDAAR